MKTKDNSPQRPIQWTQAHGSISGAVKYHYTYVPNSSVKAYCNVKRPVSCAETGRFKVQNGPFGKAERPPRQTPGTQNIIQTSRCCEIFLHINSRHTDNMTRKIPIKQLRTAACLLAATVRSNMKPALKTDEYILIFNLSSLITFPAYRRQFDSCFV